MRRSSRQKTALRFGSKFTEQVEAVYRDHMEFIAAITRVLSSLITLVLIIVLMGPQLTKKTDTLHLVRLDTSTLDIFSGLYNSLGDVLSSSSSTGDNYQEGLTTSQVIAATNLTKSMLENTPDYITSSLYNYCAHYTHHWAYDNPDNPDRHLVHEVPALDSHEIRFTNTSLYCYPQVLYDYRSLLGNYFNSLIGAAYSTNSSLVATTDESWTISPLTEPSYLEYVKHQRVIALNKIPYYTVFIGAAQVPILISGVAYYSVKENPRRALGFGHFNSALSLIVFIICSVSNISTSLSFRSFKERIFKELSSFKISLHFGRGWFCISWIIFVSTFFNMVAWAGPMWCSTPEERGEDEEETHGLYNTHAYDSTDRLEMDNRSIQIPSLNAHRLDEPLFSNFEKPKYRILDDEKNDSGSFLESFEIDLLDATGTSRLSRI